MTTPAPDRLAGRLLDDRYQVVEVIADGGMATVYRGLDTRLERDVAIKVMRPELAADPQFRARFHREARAVARLSHPGIVAVYDQGEDDADVFLVLEYVPGQTLRQVLAAEGTLTPRAALDIAAAMLRALAHAHAAGIIHRDVKPENVIIRDDGAVKVADFGLARAVTSHTATSATGMLIGTVAYLSPEQVERGVADARSDVYAAGLVLFEMLTGAKPFAGDVPIHVAYQHVHAGVPAPSTRVSGLAQPLDDLVLSATARQPDDRPEDAQSLLDLLLGIRRELTAAELDIRPSATDGPPSSADRAAQVRTRVLSPLAQRTAVEGRAASTNPLPAPAPRPAPATASAGRMAQPARVRRWPRGLLVILLLGTALGTGLWYFLAGPGSPTVVPTVAEMPYEQAAATIVDADLEPSRVEVFDETIPAGSVVSTAPGPDTQVRRGTDVEVRVSKGQERYDVPELPGLSLEQATTALEEVRLRVGEVTRAFDEEVPGGEVIASEPAAGTRLKRGDAVALTVSKGRQPIEVVDWTGKDADDATEALTSAGLEVVRGDDVYSSSVARGDIVSQDPASGTLFRGDTVTIVVSKGPQTVTMPNVVGTQLDDATKTLTELGLKVEVNRLLGGYFNTVRDQSERAGRQVRVGATITLTVV